MSKRGAGVIFSFDIRTAGSAAGSQDHGVGTVCVCLGRLVCVYVCAHLCVCTKQHVEFCFMSAATSSLSMRISGAL